MVDRLQHCHDCHLNGCYHTVGNSAPLNSVSRTERLVDLLAARDLEDMELASQAEVGVGYGRSRLHQVEAVASLAVGRGTGCKRAGYHRPVAMKIAV